MKAIILIGGIEITESSGTKRAETVIGAFTSSETLNTAKDRFSSRFADRTYFKEYAVVVDQGTEFQMYQVL